MTTNINSAGGASASRQRNRQRTMASVVGGLLLVGIGVLLLLGNLVGWSAIDALWPLFVVGFGALFFVSMVAGGPAAGGLAVPGSMFTILGMILLVQNLFGHWASMTYVWPLFAPGGVGVGLLINSWWSDRPQLKRTGYLLVVIGLGLFIGFGAFFELLFNLTGVSITHQVFWPLVLIGVGVLVLLSRLMNLERLLDWLPPHVRRTPANVIGNQLTRVSTAVPGVPGVSGAALQRTDAYSAEMEHAVEHAPGVKE